MGDFEGHLLDLGRLQQKIVLKTLMSFLWRGCCALRQVNLGEITGTWEIDGGIISQVAEGRLVIFYQPSKLSSWAFEEHLRAA